MLVSKQMRVRITMMASVFILSRSATSLCPFSPQSPSFFALIVKLFLLSDTCCFKKQSACRGRNLCSLVVQPASPIIPYSAVMDSKISKHKSDHTIFTWHLQVVFVPVTDMLLQKGFSTAKAAKKYDTWSAAQVRLAQIKYHFSSQFRLNTKAAQKTDPK